MRGSGSSSRARALRRYPALAFLALAAVLAVLLPSALTVPNSGPPTLAEFAPVPGHGPQGSGDLGRLGSGSSGGLGTNGGSGGPGQPVDPGQPPSSLKRCVGRPLRQTEDPLSPPCVAFWEGDNGGATTTGVTKDEIRIVVHLGTATAPRLIDYEDPHATEGNAQEEAFATVVRAYAAYFNARYQTYGRHVHFYGFHGGTTADTTPAAVDGMITSVHPFAMMPVGTSYAPVAAREAAAKHVVSVSFTAFDRALQQQVAPYLLSYTPDLQDEASIVSSYVCRKLAGRPARLSGNPTDRTRTRTWGIAYRDAPAEPEYRSLAQMIKARLSSGCGIDDVLLQAARSSNEGTADYGINIAQFREAAITSIIAIGTSASHLSWSAAGQQSGYYPEWILPGSSANTGVDYNSYGRQMQPLFWANAFGMTYDRRREAPKQQQWYLAFKEGCPDCVDDDDDRESKLYDQLTLLFWGIQAAGPHLDPASMDKGLHAIPARPSRDPDVPAAYFSPGNYSWVKDAMAIWWDGSASEPGTASPGCYRVAGNGRRWRAGEWPVGDGDLKVAGAPCQGPARLGRST